MVRPADPSVGAETGDDADRELLLALKSETEGLAWQEYAARLWKPELFEEEYDTGGWTDGRVRRRISRPRAILKHYRTDGFP